MYDYRERKNATIRFSCNITFAAFYKILGIPILPLSSYVLTFFVYLILSEMKFRSYHTRCSSPLSFTFSLIVSYLPSLHLHLCLVIDSTRRLSSSHTRRHFHLSSAHSFSSPLPVHRIFFPAFRHLPRSSFHVIFRYFILYTLNSEHREFTCLSVAKSSSTVLTQSLLHCCLALLSFIAVFILIVLLIYYCLLLSTILFPTFLQRHCEVLSTQAHP